MITIAFVAVALIGMIIGYLIGKQDQHSHRWSKPQLDDNVRPRTGPKVTNVSEGLVRDIVFGYSRWSQECELCGKVTTWKAEYVPAETRSP